MSTESYNEYLETKKQRMHALVQQLSELFPEKCAITLEIGCGHGHYLNAYAAAHPEEQCVGIDIISRRVFKSANKRRLAQLGNVHFFKAEAMEFLHCLPAHVNIDKTFLLFPDPWPKKRHNKNRLLQQPFLDELAKKSTSEGSFFFRTDHAEYFEWGREHLNAHSSWQVEEDAAWPFEAESFFQNLMESYQSLTARRTQDCVISQASHSA